MTPIQLNGEKMVIPNNVNHVESLLDHLNIASNFVVVEHNGDILNATSLPNTIINDNDQIEIIRFVGGGK